ncbi:MAG: DUF6105 family protein [Pseudomonadota bacterium]
MRTLLILWLLPMALFGAWFGLSAYDLNFGTRLLSRDVHDQVFTVYASVLGVEKEALPGLFGRALVFDGALIGLVVAYRKRKTLIPRIASLVS